MAARSGAWTAQSCKACESATAGMRLRSGLAGAEPGELIVGELDPGGVDVGVEMGEASRPGDRRHHRRPAQQPGEDDLLRCRLVRECDLPGEPKPRLVTPDRLPRNERDAALLTHLQLGLGYAVADI